MNYKKWHVPAVEEVMKTLQTNRNGLSERKASEMLGNFGYNEIVERRKTSSIRIFLRPFKSFLIAILFIGGVISSLIGNLFDAFVIWIILVINAVLGFVQEYRTEKAIEKLKKLMIPKVRVLREGKQREIPSRELVPGDVIILEEGGRVPADARVFEEFNLILDESILTGESTPVHKQTKSVRDLQLTERSNMVFMGTTVVYGRAKAIVVNTGMNTEMGRIAKMIQEEEESTPLQKKLNQFGKWLGLVVLGICGLVFALGYFRTLKFSDILLSSIALAVSAVPEGLPAVVTVTLALGVSRMTKRNALVRRLASVETLGCTTIICADKTGTMTTNEMTVRKIYYGDKMVEISGIGFEPKGDFIRNGEVFDPKKDKHLSLLLRTGVLCNNASIEYKDEGWRVVGDPTEGALIVLGNKAKIVREEFTSPVVEIPFSSERKIMTTLHRAEKNKLVAYVKGAPEKVLKLSTHIQKDAGIEKLTERTRKTITDRIHEMATEGLRVLALAYRKTGEVRVFDKLENNLIFLGLVGMIDPPRKEVKQAIEDCRQAGIKPVMITGDHKLTAIAVAKEIGLVEKDSELVLTGEELDRLSDEELKERIENTVIYARVSPEHKIRILDAFKKKGHVVAMTGDGVNDAPALKKADIGVAMGIKGTDVTKEASDMILTDDNFATIVNAVEEGRGIYDNIRKFVRFLLCTNFDEIALIGVSILVGLPLPLSPLQILWVNLVTDGLPALALTTDPYEPGLMKRKPRNPRSSILHGMLLFIFVAALLDFISGMFVFVWGITSIGDIEKVRTMVFTVTVFYELFFVFNCRSEKHSVFKTGIFGNKKLLIAVILSIALQVSVIYLPALQVVFKTVPLNLQEWLIIILLSATGLLVLPEIFMSRGPEFKEEKSLLMTSHS